MRIPRSGKAAEAVDCMVPHLVSKTQDLEILIDDVSEHGFLGRVWDGTQFQLASEVPTARITEFKLKVHRFYGLDRHDYNSSFDLLWSELSFLPLRSHLKDKLSQLLFNAKTPAQTSRIVALRSLLEDQLQLAAENGGYLPLGHRGRSLIALMPIIYGQRVYRHPQYSRTSAELQLVLDSLVSSGDLTKQDDQYAVTGQSLVSIAQYEEDNRRNRTSVRLTAAMVFLTACLVIIGALEVARSITSVGQP